MKRGSSEVGSLDRMEQNRQHPTAGWMRSVFIHTTDTFCVELLHDTNYSTLLCG